MGHYFDLVAFDGEIVSAVEEIDPSAVPLWHGRLSPLFSKSASFHFFSLAARGLYGGQTVGSTPNRVVVPRFIHSLST
jgi:hypothetical protein